jgi:pimeloyl-ACP methyl ester carboxylesterase
LNDQIQPKTAWRPLCAAIAALAGCGGSAAAITPQTAASACAGMTTTNLASVFPAAKTSLKAAVFQTASATVPEHCQIDGQINPRRGIDGQAYAIHFRLRLPTDWNERFFMQGGGGTNGTLVDPAAKLAQGYATIGTDSGHDNTVDNNPNAGGTGSFGVDPQARIDFAYNAYDQVAQTGKALLQSYYGKGQKYAYFQGCSEGGREGMLMSQRFPEHFDGIVAGDPVIDLPLGPMAGIYTTQLFAGLATRAGLSLANGQPAIGKSYADNDLMLVRNAVLGACDALDGLSDGIVDNLPACTKPLVHNQLLAVQCTGAKTASCLSADQIETMEKAFDGAVNSKGEQVYYDWHWDAGFTATADSATFAQNWRSWWLGSATSTTNNAIKLNYVSAVAVTYSSTPQLPFTTVDVLPFSLAYNFDADIAKIYSASAAYPQASSELYFTRQTDLSKFRDRGGKLMVYHGGSDSSVSVNSTLRWYQAMNSAMGGNAQSFARMFVVPGMNHCSGGPATDKFDMLPRLVEWVEQGKAPESVIASATTPAYFGAASRTRPLCPFPKQSRYKGSGDINNAANFSCQLPE